MLGLSCLYTGGDLTVIDPGTRHWAVFSSIHDKWQVTPKMTIDLGLRHEYYTPLVGLAYQRQLPRGFTAEVAYVGNRGNVVNTVNANAGMVLGADNAGRPQFGPFGRTA